MAKAATKRTTQTHDPDAGLLAMIRRHDELWAAWDSIVKVDEDDPRIDGLSSECWNLERRIVATAAFTSDGLIGKRRVVDRAELEDDHGIVETIFSLDTERVAAAG
jgi:hypothetical protein